MIAHRYVAEMIGTFCLVFAGTGAIIANNVSDGAVTHPGIALTFGLVVMAMIYSVGDVSGAHLNPVVTFGFWLARKLSASSLQLGRSPELRASAALRTLLSLGMSTGALGSTNALIT